MFLYRTINDNRMVVMADAHLGSIQADMHLIDLTYNYAIKNGIRNVVFAGDFIQGKTHKEDICYSFNNQIEHVLFALSKINT